MRPAGLVFCKSPVMAEKQPDDIAERLDRRNRLREVAEKNRLRLVERLDAEGGVKLADRIRNCGAEFSMTCTGCGAGIAVPQRCKVKWCPVCARIKSAERAAKLRIAVEQMADPVHLTLTMANVTDWSRPHLRHLIESFGRLRRNKVWQRCKGGVYNLEVTNKGKGWHPHLHALIDCSWLSHLVPEPTRHTSKFHRKNLSERAHAELCAVWGMCLRQDGSDPSVWVRRCDVGAAAEIAKYVIKPDEIISITQSIIPLIQSLQSCRVTASFGSMRGKTKIKTDDSDRPKLSCACGCNDLMPSFMVAGMERSFAEVASKVPKAEHSAKRESRRSAKIRSDLAEITRQLGRKR